MAFQDRMISCTCCWPLLFYGKLQTSHFLVPFQSWGTYPHQISTQVRCPSFSNSHSKPNQEHCNSERDPIHNIRSMFLWNFQIHQIIEKHRISNKDHGTAPLFFILNFSLNHFWNQILLMSVDQHQIYHINPWNCMDIYLSLSWVQHQNQTLEKHSWIYRDPPCFKSTTSWLRLDAMNPKLSMNLRLK